VGGSPLSGSHYDNLGVKVLRDNQGKPKAKAKAKLNGLFEKSRCACYRILSI